MVDYSLIDCDVGGFALRQHPTPHTTGKILILLCGNLTRHLTGDPLNPAGSPAIFTSHVMEIYARFDVTH
jgi:hypothetical protein